MIVIDGDFENGCLDRAIKLGKDWYHLELRQDTWYRFHFRVKGCKDRDIIFQFTCNEITSPGYEEGKGRWIYEDGTIVYPIFSYDKKRWQPVSFMEKDRSIRGTYRFRQKFKQDKVYITFGQPYTYSDLQDWLRGLPKEQIEFSSIGQSRNGYDQTLLSFSRNKESKKIVLFISREDADEQLGSFAVEGMVDYLLNDNLCTKALLEKYIVKIVPMVCVDGVIAGGTHSAGYGYGGHHWHEEPAPEEIQNIKEQIRKWNAEGFEVVLAGKIHSGMTMQPTSHCIDMISSDQHLINDLCGNSTEYWKPARGQLEIREKGYFERFMADEFGLRKTYGTHVQGNTPDALRQCGKDMLKAVIQHLKNYKKES